MLNKICFTVCILSIVAGMAISILAIWRVIGDLDIVYRSLATLGVLFLGSVLTVSVNHMFAGTLSRKPE